MAGLGTLLFNARARAQSPTRRGLPAGWHVTLVLGSLMMVFSFVVAQLLAAAGQKGVYFPWFFAGSCVVAGGVALFKTRPWLSTGSALPFSWPLAVAQALSGVVLGSVIALVNAMLFIVLPQTMMLEGYIERYKNLNEEISTQASWSSGYFTSEGELLDDKKAAWCAHAQPLVEFVDRYENSGVHNSGSLVGVLTRSSYETLLRSGCITPQVFLSRSLALQEFYQNHPNPFTQFNQAMVKAHVPGLNILGQSEPQLLGRIVPTQFSLCTLVVGPANAHNPVEACQGWSTQKPATMKDLNNMLSKSTHEPSASHAR